MLRRISTRHSWDCVMSTSVVGLKSDPSSEQLCPTVSVRVCFLYGMCIDVKYSVMKSVYALFVVLVSSLAFTISLKHLRFMNPSEAKLIAVSAL